MQFKINTAILLIAFIGISKGVPSEKLPATTEAEKSTTTTPLPSPSTTEANTTVEPKTTPSSTTPSSTTTTTTTSTTTTAAPSTSTTSAPVPTTKAPIPPKPTPVPDPEFGLWNYTDDRTKQTCIIAQLALQLNLTYTTTSNQTANVLYNVPAKNATVHSGDCGNGTGAQNIVLQWGNATTGNSSLLLNFSFNTTRNVFALTEIVFELNTTALPNGTDDTIKLYYVGDTFAAPKDMSYHCTKVQTLSLADNEKSNKTVAWVRVSHVQLEAYHKRADAQFSIAKDCDAIDTPDIVPIAVGCALAALVVVVLIAYLVGRRRAQARGYVSM